MYDMRLSGVYVVWLAVCCLHTASEPTRTPEHRTNVARRRRSDDRDGLALSREIFRNITKKLRENIRDPVQSLSPNTVDESRRHVPYQEYHHHEYHWGPYFEQKNVTQVTAHVGSEALLNCRVVMLKDKTVIWLRNTTDTAQLLTVGRAPYAGDNRVALKFQYPNNWKLSINPVKRGDAGLYMCQISTHPPRTIYTNLTVLPPVISINGDQTHEMKDRFYKAGSSIKLSCIISDDFITSFPTTAPVTTTTPPPTTTTMETTTKISTVFNRIDLMMNKSWSVETTTITSTVSVSTEAGKTTTQVTTVAPTSPPVENNVFGLYWTKQGKEFYDNVTTRNVSATISVASASQNDTGTYTCFLRGHSQVTINVHVLIGENQAAVHHDTWNKGLFWKPTLSSIYVLTFLLVFN